MLLERSGRKDKLNKRKTGTFYETAACEYLKKSGILILEKNYRCRFGEIDLIGLEGTCLVFFEVKYRKNGYMGLPQEAVGREKQKTICKCASCYCMLHPQYRQLRYDVVAILGTEIEWIQNAFAHRGYLFY